MHWLLGQQQVAINELTNWVRLGPTLSCFKAQRWKEAKAP